MATLEQILDRKKEVSGQVSAQARTLALGMLAISWALLTVHDEPLHTMALHVSRYLLLALAVCSVFIVAFDLLQYVYATRVAQAAFEVAQAASPKEALYDNTSFDFKASAQFYHLKFKLLILAAILLAIIFFELFRSPVPPQAAAPACCCATCTAAPVPPSPAPAKQ